MRRNEHDLALVPIACGLQLRKSLIGLDLRCSFAEEVGVGGCVECHEHHSVIWRFTCVRDGSVVAENYPSYSG